MEAITLAGTTDLPMQELHTTGDFTNARNEVCRVSMELDVHDNGHDYNVRSSIRTIARVGGQTVVTTTETVETLYSMKVATRAYNWCLYLTAATEQQEREFKLT